MMAAVAALAVSVLILAAARRSRWQFLALPEVAPAPEAAGAAGCVTAVVPARDEERVITRCVASLAPDCRVLVVDDHSSDNTAAAARAAGAEVVAAPPLPDGWLGKPHACWTGAQRAETEWILFVDADTWYEPGLAAALVRFAERRGLDAVTVFPRQHCQRWFEAALVEYGLGLYFAGVVAARLNDPASPDALANGQCLLVRRQAYFRAGGHRAVAGSVTEDVALAAAFKRSGVRLAVARAPQLAHVRMYDSFGALWRGFQKNSFRVLFHNPRAGWGVVAASIVMTSWLPASALALAAGQRLAALLPPAAAVIGWKPWYGSWRRALWAPLAIYLFQGIVLSAMLASLTGRGVLWKGRRV